MKVVDRMTNSEDFTISVEAVLPTAEATSELDQGISNLRFHLNRAGAILNRSVKLVRPSSISLMNP